MLSKITILYVEDEDIIRDAIETILPQLFKKVILAIDGENGLDLYKKHQEQIDLVVTDINMPKMDGLQMLAEIKKISPFLPTCITTAHSDTIFLQKAIDLSVNAYVNKPMNIIKLIDVIKENILPLVEKKNLEKQLDIQREKELQNVKFYAIGQLSAGIIHEINTPLTFIKGTFEMMKYDIDDLEESSVKVSLNNDAKTIVDGIRRIENIISSMKEMACISQDNKEKVNIYSSIITALVMTYNKSKHLSHIYINNIKFNINQDKNEFEFFTTAQKQRIEQVWIVIVNNAMDEFSKINDFEQARLDIYISNCDDKVEVVFKDNAGGIPNDILPYIFEPFKSTKESSGMGVGLNIAKKIILDNDGTLDAHNEDDGAIFKIVL
jgi:C4-dicarboxylate-specific signal transduction histidine kinase